VPSFTVIVGMAVLSFRGQQSADHVDIASHPLLSRVRKIGRLHRERPRADSA
jgi:hypothetical protein